MPSLIMHLCKPYVKQNKLSEIQHKINIKHGIAFVIHDIASYMQLGAYVIKRYQVNCSRGIGVIAINIEIYVVSSMKYTVIPLKKTIVCSKNRFTCDGKVTGWWLKSNREK